MVAISPLHLWNLSNCGGESESNSARVRKTLSKKWDRNIPITGISSLEIVKMMAYFASFQIWDTCCFSKEQEEERRSYRRADCLALKGDFQDGNIVHSLALLVAK